MNNIAMIVPAIGIVFPIFDFVVSKCLARYMARMKLQCTANFIFNNATRIKKVNGATIVGIFFHAIKPYSRNVWYSSPKPGTLSVASYIGIIFPANVLKFRARSVRVGMAIHIHDSENAMSHITEPSQIVCASKTSPIPNSFGLVFLFWRPL